MRVELEVAGHDVEFVTVNITTGIEKSDELTKRTSYPHFQDTAELGIWDLLGGYKDDFYVFDREGKLHTYLRFYGEVPTTLSEADGYNAVKQAILSAVEGKGAGDPSETHRDSQGSSPSDLQTTDATLPEGDVGPEPSADVSHQSDAAGDVGSAPPAADATSADASSGDVASD